jgi:Rhodopirellula transposase DDE domain
MNWRGKPLVSLQSIVNLIGATATSGGLEVYARSDEGTYPDKIKVPDADLKAANLQSDSSTRSGTTASNHDVVIYGP